MQKLSPFRHQDNKQPKIIRILPFGKVIQSLNNRFIDILRS